MTYETLNNLLISYEKTDITELYEYDYDLFMLFYDIFKDKPFTEIPDTAFMFIEIDSWSGTSMRGGVWQYYEINSEEQGKSERVAEYLKSHGGYDDMADIYAFGIHDYQKYTEISEYPEEWLDESYKIDNWIYENENYIYQWKKDLISSHKNEILKLAKK